MSRCRVLSIRAGALALGLCLLAPSAFAHTLDLATARVTLRDGHAEVVAEVDVVQLVTRFAAEPADATSIATASDAALAEWITAARKSVEDGARMDADAVPVALVLRAFPTSKEVRFLAAQASGSPHPHGEMSALRFESTQPIGDARSISVALPNSLGRVLYTFVQPETRLAPAGAPASFEVLSAPRRELPVAQASPSGRTWLALGAGLMAAIALLAQILPRRGATRPALAQDKGGAA